MTVGWHLPGFALLMLLIALSFRPTVALGAESPVLPEASTVANENQSAAGSSRGVDACGDSDQPVDRRPVCVSMQVGRVSLAAPGDDLGRKRIARWASAAAASPPFVAQTHRMDGDPRVALSAPVAGARMTSGYGLRRHPINGGVRMHSGVDLAAPTGTPVRAASDGVVALAGWRGGYGLAVELDHGQTLVTRYAHLSRLAVQRGQRVRRGELIGFVGSTGRSTGPHLHYEVWFQARTVAPR
jgi:murein DD-endopeptidase MepM/ murein hydrolase activator NlpD